MATCIYTYIHFIPVGSWGLSGWVSAMATPFSRHRCGQRWRSLRATRSTWSWVGRVSSWWRSAGVGQAAAQQLIVNMLPACCMELASSLRRDWFWQRSHVPRILLWNEQYSYFLFISIFQPFVQSCSNNLDYFTPVNIHVKKLLLLLYFSLPPQFHFIWVAFFKLHPLPMHKCAIILETRYLMKLKLL